MSDVRTLQASKARLKRVIFEPVVSSGTKITGFYIVDAKDNAGSAFNFADGNLLTVGSIGYSKTGITLKGTDKARPIKLVKVSLVNSFGGNPTKDSTTVKVWDYKNELSIVSDIVSQSISVSGIYDINDEIMQELANKFMKSTTILDASGKASQVEVNNDIVYFMLVLNEETNSPDDFVNFKYYPMIIKSFSTEIPESGFVPFTFEGEVQGQLLPQELRIQKKYL